MSDKYYLYRVQNGSYYTPWAPHNGSFEDAVNKARGLAKEQVPPVGGPWTKLVVLDYMTLEEVTVDVEEAPPMWVAWHPKYGSNPTTYSKSGCEENLLAINYQFEYPDVFARAEAYFAARDAKLQEAYKDGWKIRPVKLVFLDEGK